MELDLLEHLAHLRAQAEAAGTNWKVGGHWQLIIGEGGIVQGGITGLFVVCGLSFVVPYFLSGIASGVKLSTIPCNLSRR
jgi:hypothetical protein